MGRSMGLFNKILHAGEGKKLKSIESIVPAVGSFEPEMQRRSDDELRALTATFRDRLAQAPEGDDRIDLLDDLLPEAFAAVREAASRVIGQRHYDVQLMGGAALHFGWVAEMKTGEGKTLVATLPLYLNALLGEGVHLITANDYLAKRDAEWMGRIYRFLGLEVGVVLPQIDDPALKRIAYAADITYGTNNEFGFDYLRDNMTVAREDQVQRGHTFAIVDEVDFVLIDEARTPLIISGRADDAQELYHRFAGVVKDLRRDRGGNRARRVRARGGEPLRARQPELRAPAPGRAARQGAVQARRRLRRPTGRGEDRRRVHRPHPRR